MRASTSVPPPAGNGTMMRSGFDVVSASARRAKASAAADIRTARRLTAAALHELERGAKELDVFLVVGGVGAIDLHPFPRRAEPGRLKRHDVVARELQLSRRGRRQAQADTGAADAGEHAVADKIGVQALDLSRADAGQLEEHGVDLRLTAGNALHAVLLMSSSFSSPNSAPSSMAKRSPKSKRSSFWNPG